MSLTYTAGRSWVEIERAGTRELLNWRSAKMQVSRRHSHEAHRTAPAANTTTGMVRHEGTVAAFRCPIVGCVDVSGRTIRRKKMENDLSEMIYAIDQEWLATLYLPTGMRIHNEPRRCFRASCEIGSLPRRHQLLIPVPEGMRELRMKYCR